MVVISKIIYVSLSSSKIRYKQCNLLPNDSKIFFADYIELFSMKNGKTIILTFPFILGHSVKKSISLEGMFLQISSQLLTDLPISSRAGRMYEKKNCNELPKKLPNHINYCYSR